MTGQGEYLTSGQALCFNGDMESYQAEIEINTGDPTVGDDWSEAAVLETAREIVRSFGFVDAADNQGFGWLVQVDEGELLEEIVAALEVDGSWDRTSPDGLARITIETP